MKNRGPCNIRKCRGRAVLGALNSNCGVSDQQSLGSSPSRGTCVLKQDHLNIASSFGWDVKPSVPCFCNAQMFLVGLAAYCATAPCKPLHGAIKGLGLIILTESNILHAIKEATIIIIIINISRYLLLQF